jgi:RNA polymerase sigma factor (sigma-70 family)
VKEYTDIEIIECLKNRQSYVVQWLSDRYLPMVKLIVLPTGGSPEDAKDIFQDGLLIMLEKLDSEDFVLACKFKTYLYCVCEHLWSLALGKRHAAANYFNRKVEEDTYVDFTEIQDNKLCETIFNDVFNSLDPVYKKILKLHWKELSHKEIADKLGLADSYVKKLKCEGQAELIKKVKSHPDYRRIKDSEMIVKNVVY